MNVVAAKTPSVGLPPATNQNEEATTRWENLASSLRGTEEKDLSDMIGKEILFSGIVVSSKPKQLIIRSGGEPENVAAIQCLVEPPKHTNIRFESDSTSVQILGILQKIDTDNRQISVKAKKIYITAAE